jgi:hypothetical protein
MELVREILLHLDVNSSNHYADEVELNPIYHFLAFISALKKAISGHKLVARNIYSELVARNIHSDPLSKKRLREG